MVGGRRASDTATLYAVCPRFAKAVYSFLSSGSCMAYLPNATALPNWLRLRFSSFLGILFSFTFGGAFSVLFRLFKVGYSDLL